MFWVTTYKKMVTTYRKKEEFIVIVTKKGEKFFLEKQNFKGQTIDELYKKCIRVMKEEEFLGGDSGMIRCSEIECIFRGNDNQ
jgi:urease gamma subunit